MPDITPEMIEWWFWWHPKKNERYQVWFPGEHYSIGYSKKQSDYFESEFCPAFKNNTQYPVERIGKMKMPLRIDFITPEEFGFSKSVILDKSGLYMILWAKNSLQMISFANQNRDERSENLICVRNGCFLNCK